MAVSRINEAGLNVNQYGNRNIIINGAMRVAQRGTSATGQTTTADYTTVDRFTINNDFPTGVTSVATSQDSDGPSGFSNSFKVEPEQARTAALSGADRFFINYSVEAQDLQQLDYNTSSAKNLTLSFWIKSNLTGIVSLEINAADSTDSNYQYLHESVTINTADTWEYKTVSIPGNVNNPINDDNGTGIGITWIFAAGPTFTSGTFTTGVWHDTTAANRASSSNIDIYSSASNYVKLTGVQLEVGDTATDFEHRTFGDELRRCQRYYFRLDGGSADSLGFQGQMYTTTNAQIFGRIPTMRAAPTPEVSAQSGVSTLGGTIVTLSSPSFTALTTDSFRLSATTSSSITAGTFMFLRVQSNQTGYIDFDAEL